MSIDTINNIPHQDNFIKQLNHDISIRSQINKNAKTFIEYKKIKNHKFNKKLQNITEDDLPIQTILGSSYLIKGNNILEIYSWCDKDYSLYIQKSIKKPSWIGKINIINTEKKDPENLVFLLDGYDIFRNSSELQCFIVMFIKDGFLLYI